MKKKVFSLIQFIVVVLICCRVYWKSIYKIIAFPEICQHLYFDEYYPLCIIKSQPPQILYLFQKSSTGDVIPLSIWISMKRNLPISYRYNNEKQNFSKTFLTAILYIIATVIRTKDISRNPIKVVVASDPLPNTIKSERKDSSSKTIQPIYVIPVRVLY